MNFIKKWRKKNNKTKVEKEFGDVLFSMINYARFIGVDPESALERTNKKFIGRFNYLEKEVNRKGLKLENEFRRNGLDMG